MPHAMCTSTPTPTGGGIPTWMGPFCSISYGPLHCPSHIPQGPEWGGEHHHHYTLTLGGGEGEPLDPGTHICIHLQMPVVCYVPCHIVLIVWPIFDEAACLPIFSCGRSGCSQGGRVQGGAAVRGSFGLRPGGPGTWATWSHDIHRSMWSMGLAAS